MNGILAYLLWLFLKYIYRMTRIVHKVSCDSLRHCDVFTYNFPDPVLPRGQPMLLSARWY